jgi:hypothetical protein
MEQEIEIEESGHSVCYKLIGTENNDITRKMEK